MPKISSVDVSPSFRRETVNCLRDRICVKEVVEQAHASPTSVLHAYADGLIIGALDYSQVGNDLFVNIIYVKPDFRGRGVASALLQALRSRSPDGTLHCEFAKEPRGQ